MGLEGDNGGGVFLQLGDGNGMACCIIFKTIQMS